MSLSDIIYLQPFSRKSGIRDGFSSFSNFLTKVNFQKFYFLIFSRTVGDKLVPEGNQELRIALAHVQIFCPGYNFRNFNSDVFSFSQERLEIN